MALYQRNKSKIWWVDLAAPNGERIRKSTKTDNKQLAREYEKKLEQDLFKIHQLGHKAERTLEEAVMKFLAAKSDKDAIDKYEQQLEWWKAKLGAGTKLHRITKEMIVEAIEQKLTEGTSKSTCNRYLSALRACLRHVHRAYSWIDTVPVFVMYEEPRGRTRWITPEEVTRLIDGLPAHLRGPAVVALTTGLRRSRVLQLRWSQVDLSRRVITISGDEMKNGENHTVPIPDLAMDVITKQIGQSTTRVFTYKGGSFDKFSTKTWKEALARAGIDDLRWHDLRHTWATMLVQNGAPDSVLMALGSWKTARMVKRYAHHNVNSVRPYAEIVDGVLSGAVAQTRHTPSQPEQAPRLRLVG